MELLGSPRILVLVVIAFVFVADFLELSREAQTNFDFQWAQTVDDSGDDEFVAQESPSYNSSAEDMADDVAETVDTSEISSIGNATIGEGDDLNANLVETNLSFVQTQSPTRPPSPIIVRQGFSHDNKRQEDWKYAAKNAGWDTYPISDEMMARTYVPGEMAHCGFRGLRARLDAGRPVTIGVFGDSVSWGFACRSRQWGFDGSCAWPHRVAVWLRERYPRWKIRLVSYAQRSFGPANFLDLPYDIDRADAYILAFLLTTPESYIRLLNALKGPKILLGIARTCQTAIGDCNRHCHPDKVLSVPMGNRTRLSSHDGYYVQSPTKPSYMCPGWWRGAQVAKEVAQRTGMSAAMYSDVYWAEEKHPSKDLPFFWNGLSHPDTVAHDFMSHVVEYALWNEFSYEGPSCNVPRNAKQTCSDGLLGVIDVKAPERSVQPVVANGWRLFEDVPTKPGWIAEAFNNTSELTFELKVSKSLAITYLASYANIYPAVLEIQGCEATPIVLEPRWETLASMPKTSKFSGIQNVSPEHQYLACMPSNTTRIRVTLRALTGKFKLLGVVTC